MYLNIRIKWWSFWSHVDDGQICASNIKVINYIRTALEHSFELLWKDPQDNSFLTLNAATPMLAGLLFLTAADQATPVN